MAKSTDRKENAMSEYCNGCGNEIDECICQEIEDADWKCPKCGKDTRGDCECEDTDEE